MSKRYLYFVFALLLFTTSLKAQVIFPDIDVKYYIIALTLNDQDDSIRGRTSLDIKFLNDVSQFELNLVKKNDSGKGMLVSSVIENGRDLKFSQDADIVTIYASAKKNSAHTFTISYSGVPADGLIISKNMFGHRTFFGDNWPNRAHNWIPCADYLSDKASVDFLITAPDHYEVVANGQKVSEKELPGHLKFTHWSEHAQLAPVVMVIGVADFAIEQSGTVKNVPVYSYVFPENKANGFKSYSYAPDILSFYDDKFGPYAFEKLANVQSKTIFGGMENSGAIFYDEKLIGIRFDEELMAHEIAHQWFGDAITEKTWKDLWLSEGFATYISSCYLEHKYGPDTLKKREADDRKKVIGFERRHFAPVVDSAVKTDFTQLLNANSYEKGGWVLHMLRRKIGDTLFWQGLRNYYAKKAGGNATSAEFEQIIEQTSGQDLHQFFKQWLTVPGHPDLKLTWQYDADKKQVNITIIQKQEYMFQFQLEYSIDGELHKADIDTKTTSIIIATDGKPASIKMDPNVNLLAGFEVVEE